MRCVANLIAMRIPRSLIGGTIKSLIEEIRSANELVRDGHEAYRGSRHCYHLVTRAGKRAACNNDNVDIDRGRTRADFFTTAGGGRTANSIARWSVKSRDRVHRRPCVSFNSISHETHAPPGLTKPRDSITVPLIIAVVRRETPDNFRRERGKKSGSCEPSTDRRTKFILRPYFRNVRAKYATWTSSTIYILFVSILPIAVFLFSRLL